MKLSYKKNPPRVRRNRMRSGCPSLFLMSHAKQSEAMTAQKVRPFHSIPPPPRLPCPIWHPTRDSQWPALTRSSKSNAHTVVASREITTYVEHLQSLEDCLSASKPVDATHVGPSAEWLIWSCSWSSKHRHIWLWSSSWRYKLSRVLSLRITRGEHIALLI